MSEQDVYEKLRSLAGRTVRFGNDLVGVTLEGKAGQIVTDVGKDATFLKLEIKVVVPHQVR